LYDRFSNDSKFKIARHVLSQLDTMGEEGHAIQRRILTETCKLRKLPDEQRLIIERWWVAAAGWSALYLSSSSGLP
jgi:hypothetical protein